MYIVLRGNQFSLFLPPSEGPPMYCHRAIVMFLGWTPKAFIQLVYGGFLLYKMQGHGWTWRRESQWGLLVPGVWPWCNGQPEAQTTKSCAVMTGTRCKCRAAVLNRFCTATYCSNPLIKRHTSKTRIKQKSYSRVYIYLLATPPKWFTTPLGVAIPSLKTLV